MLIYKRFLVVLGSAVMLYISATSVFAENMQLTIANGIHKDVPTHWWFKEFIGPELEKRSKGRIKSNVQVNGTLCSEHECVEQALMGQIDIGSVSAGNIGSFGNTFDILNLPYIFKDDESAEALVNGWLGDELIANADVDMGLHVLAIIPSYSFRHVGNNKKVVHTPKEMKGLKIRVTKSPVELGLIKAWDGVAVPFDWAALYEGLSTGVVNGYYIPTAYVAAQKFYEVAPYLTETGGGWNAHIIFMSKKRYNALPEWARGIIDEIASAIRERSFALDAEWEKEKKSELEGRVDIYKPTAEEMEMWYKGAVEVWPKVNGTYDKSIARRVLEEQNQVRLIEQLDEAGAL